MLMQEVIGEKVNEVRDFIIEAYEERENEMQKQIDDLEDKLTWKIDEYEDLEDELRVCETEILRLNEELESVYKGEHLYSDFSGATEGDR